MFDESDAALRLLLRNVSLGMTQAATAANPTKPAETRWHYRAQALRALDVVERMLSSSLFSDDDRRRLSAAADRLRDGIAAIPPIGEADRVKDLRDRGCS